MVPGPEVERGGCAPGEGWGAGKGRFKGQAAKHGAEAASEAEKGLVCGVGERMVVIGYPVISAKSALGKCLRGTPVPLLTAI